MEEEEEGMVVVVVAVAVAARHTCREARPDNVLSNWRSAYAFTADRSFVVNSSRRHFSNSFASAGQPSRRTVSMPFASNAPIFWSGLSYDQPTYLSVWSVWR